ncbi:hypothetical protein SGLAD_v1c02090 [Spiroplasma gladiatoris]|uniref:Transmembrane protein n=1 Tax=Spiroplasma gladiatoris TaxID=2143 RepID=A0A4P7AI66_9MOLU|nr:hypothetical protein [Spiroplasma gladiatoris]QBQ07408.1 hypothetical protein SGLAD_v1c02090 [Spiroplasma gladiatoris]
MAIVKKQKKAEVFVSNKNNPKTKFSDKFKNFKQDLKIKTKEQLSAASIGGKILYTLVIILRILVILFWFIAPILITLAFVYDPGFRSLVWYICAKIKNVDTVNGMQVPSMDIAFVNKVINIAAPIICFVSFIIFLPAVVWPFYSKTQWRKRVFYATNLFFWPILFLVVDYSIYFLKSSFPKGPEIDINGPYYPLRIAYEVLNANYTPFSGWNIAYQVVWFFLIFLAVFVSVEASLIRKLRLDYEDLYSETKDSRSLVNQVFEGRLEFGEIKAENLNKEIKQLRGNLTLEERQRRLDRLDRLKQEKDKLKQEKSKRKSKNKKSTKKIDSKAKKTNKPKDKKDM